MLSPFVRRGLDPSGQRFVVLDEDEYRRQLDERYGADPAARRKYRIRQTVLKDGRQVSTVFVIDDGWETMVFPSVTDSRELLCRRYDTREEAYWGHISIVMAWKKRRKWQAPKYDRPRKRDRRRG
jgi:hypothetical protein